jgi:23S rRNA (pseudouridine1915-N3)-methyltransferase
MRIWIAAIGNRSREGFEDLARLYLDRLAPLLPGAGGKAGVDAPVFRTEQAFWEAVEREKSRTAPLVVLLDEGGKQMGSEAFAAWLGRAFDDGRQLIIFAIGPADGWGKQSAEHSAQSSGKGKSVAAPGPDAMTLSLGPMTMAHELARVVLCEQVYRALTILKGHPYHRS